MKIRVCILFFACAVVCLYSCRSIKAPSGTDSYYSLAQISNLVAGCRTSQDVISSVGSPSNIIDLDNGFRSWIYHASDDIELIDDIGGFSVYIADDGRVISWKPIYTFRTIWRDGKAYRVKSFNEE